MPVDNRNNEIKIVAGKLTAHFTKAFSIDGFSRWIVGYKDESNTVHYRGKRKKSKEG
jgi:hypothetical protein